MTTMEALDAEPKKNVTFKITKAQDNNANHFEANVDINVFVAEFLKTWFTPAAIKEDHFYCSFYRATWDFRGWAPTSIADRIILAGTFALATKVTSYRLTPEMTMDSDNAIINREEGLNYGHLKLAPNFPPDKSVIEDGAKANLASMGLKFNSINVRRDEAGHPTSEWRIGWTTTDKFVEPMLGPIGIWKVGGIEMRFVPNQPFCTEKGIHFAKGCFKFDKTKRYSPAITCQCGSILKGGGSTSGGKGHKRTAEEAFKQRSRARQVPDGF
jgi:hypothetical protein